MIAKSYIMYFLRVVLKIGNTRWNICNVPRFTDRTRDLTSVKCCKFLTVDGFNMIPHLINAGKWCLPFMPGHGQIGDTKGALLLLVLFRNVSDNQGTEGVSSYNIITA